MQEPRGGTEIGGGQGPRVGTEISGGQGVVLAIIPIALIDRDIPQARRLWRAHGGKEKLTNLVRSVEDWGVIQPVLLAPRDGGRYLLVAGHRRYVAAVRANQTHLPAIIRQMDDEQARVLQLVENVQRAEMSALDEAQVYAALLETHGSISAVARLVGVSHSVVSGRIRILRDKLVAQGVKDGLIAPSIAQQVISIMEPYDSAIRHKLQHGERVSSDDVLAARTRQGEDNVTNPHAVIKAPPRGYFTPANNRGFNHLTPVPTPAPSSDPASAPETEPDQEPAINPLEALRAFEERQAAATKVTYAEERPDPVYAGVIKRRVDGEIDRRTKAYRDQLSARRDEGSYGQNPEHVVVERPASKYALRPALDPAKALEECAALVAPLERVALNRLLNWAGDRGMTVRALRDTITAALDSAEDRRDVG